MDPPLDLCKKSYGRTFNCLVSKILFQKVQFSFKISIDVGLRTFSKNSQKLAVLNLMRLRKLSDTAFPLLFHRRRKKRTPSLQVHNRKFFLKFKGKVCKHERKDPYQFSHLIDLPHLYLNSKTCKVFRLDKIRRATFRQLQRYILQKYHYYRFYFNLRQRYISQREI